MKPVRVHIDWKIPEGNEKQEGWIRMSHPKNVKYALRVLEYRYDSIIDTEEGMREKFSIPRDKVCADGCCHEPQCPLILVEVEEGQADKGVKQLEKTAELLIERGQRIREVVLVGRTLKRLSSYTKDKDKYVVIKRTRSRVKVHGADLRFVKRI